MDVSAVAPSRIGEGTSSKPTGWDRARLGVVVPLCIVVTVAIGCIVVAALSSAQRADEVALVNEKQLFLKALNTRADWSLRKLAALSPSQQELLGLNAEQFQSRLARWLKTLQDHDFVVLADAANRLSYAQIDRSQSAPRWIAAPFQDFEGLLDYVRGHGPQPARAIHLGPTVPPTDGRPVQRAAFLLQVTGMPAIVSAVTLGPIPNEPTTLGNEGLPVLLGVMFLDEDVLADFGNRLHLQHIRRVDQDANNPKDFVFSLTDANNETIARFAWTPNRPGAEILTNVIPFIGIALASFAVLAGLVLAYMRRTAATIAAGENRLRYLALHDPLCGLPNRIFFGERLEAVLAGVTHTGSPAAVFYIDLDHFKDVNDTLGHPIGDELIRNVSMRLSHTMRGDDLVARLGGDEFAVITSAASDHDALHNIASRMIATLCAPYSINGHPIVIGASIGIAIIDHRSQGSADIMRYADMALYRAKNEGRNRACIYDAEMDADLSNRKLVEQDLREAIARRGLTVLYQPIVNASGEKVVCVEALARWPHPVRGFIPPGDFIPIAEHSGLIIELGQNVLRQACLDGKNWPGVTVAVNVSPLQFRQIDFVSVVERILAETGFDPSRLELELTESTLLGNVESAEAAMHRLKALGVRLALDDFGTGYSSLLYLRRFPFDKLKIDRSFVLSIEKAADAAAIVHAIVSLGRGLGMKVTAEGVETAEQHLFLRAAGVHCMQGFRFGTACTPQEIANRIAKPGVYRSIEGDAVAALAS
jgi:diguanylate cyclase (GGDEF)-like protein